MSDWPTETIEACLAPLSLGHLPKLQTKSYERQGTYPIIDQGQDLVAGWTDDSTGLISSPLPLVVFGDHTRALKYVDFPFVRGADGTQVLKPRAGIDPLYFYYACRAVDLPSRGYNRHFAALKESEIGLPPKEEQIAIGHLMRHIERCCDLQGKQLGTAQSLKTAAMRALFTRGLKGEAQKETAIGMMPKSWKVVSLGSLGKIGSGTTPDRQNSEYWRGGIVPWITSGRMYEPEILGADECVTPYALEEASLPLLRPGAVLIAIVGQGKTLGHCSILRVEATISRHVGFIQPKNEIVVSEYLLGYLESQYTHLRQLASGNGSTRASLTAAILRSVQIPLPPTLQEQREIVSPLEIIDRKIELHRRKLVVLDDLLRTLLHKLMTGETRVDQLDLSALSTATPADVAA